MSELTREQVEVRIHNLLVVGTGRDKEIAQQLMDTDAALRAERDKFKQMYQAAYKLIHARAVPDEAASTPHP